MARKRKLDWPQGLSNEEFCERVILLARVADPTSPDFSSEGLRSRERREGAEHRVERRRGAHRWSFYTAWENYGPGDAMERTTRRATLRGPRYKLLVYEEVDHPVHELWYQRSLVKSRQC